MESETTKNKVNPREDANIFSVIFFIWTIKLFKTGYSKAIEEEDLFETLKEDRSKLLGNNLEKNWMKEVERAGAIKTNASLFRALVKTFSWDFVILGLFVFANDIIIRFGHLKTAKAQNLIDLRALVIQKRLVLGLSQKYIQ
uniref:Uncharacterized protein n=1 Tax=Timema poppense TaxID=170557 RepID=A0A7R9CUV9_TIMPO|nr:unnamed protein product [Timema poppensis]